MAKNDSVKQVQLAQLGATPTTMLGEAVRIREQNIKTNKSKWK